MRVALVGWDEVELVQHQPARFVVERFVVALELLDDRTCLDDRIGFPVERRQVDDVQQ